MIDHEELITKVIEKMQAMNENDKWFKTSDKLPEIGKYVLTYSDNVARQVGARFHSSDPRAVNIKQNLDSDWFWGIQDQYAKPEQITHWAHLLEKPQ